MVHEEGEAFAAEVQLYGAPGCGYGFRVRPAGRSWVGAGTPRARCSQEGAIKRALTTLKGLGVTEGRVVVYSVNSLFDTAFEISKASHCIANLKWALRLNYQQYIKENPQGEV